MINLLPPERKSDYRYARRNSRLMNVIMVFVFGFAGLAAVTAVGVVYIQQASNTYAAQAEQIQESLVKQKQGEVEARVQDVSDSLKLAVQVLSQEVLFSQLLKQLATAVPSNASLTGINISELQGAVDVSARTANYNSATQLQVNLADPANKIFSKADIVNIVCGTDTAGTEADKRYPCSVDIRAQFAADNPFLFINDKAGGQ